MTVSLASRLGLALLVTVAALSACSSNDKKDDGYRPKNPFAKNDRREPSAGKPAVTEQELKAEADKLYRVARGALESSDFTEATTRYNLLMERYPFTEYAAQAELEKIYVLNRDYKPDEALSAADRFLREHPRHPRADYVQYLKGIVQSERDKGLTDALPIDPSRKDVGNLRRAYDEFALLIQKYPNSRYNEDARARMMELRNRIANNEMHVVDFYMRRGAWLAAAKRAEQVIAQFPGAPATLDALKTLERCYRELGLKQEAEDASRTLAAQTGQMTLATAPLQVVALDGTAPPAAVPSAPAAPAAAPQQSKGFFSRIAGLFSGLDRSNKEPLELVLPSASSSPKAATPAAAPSADGQSAPAAATPSPEAPKKSNRLIIEYNTGEDEPKKEENTAPPPNRDAPSSNP